MCSKSQLGKSDENRKKPQHKLTVAFLIMKTVSH